MPNWRADCPGLRRTIVHAPSTCAARRPLAPAGCLPCVCGGPWPSGCSAAICRRCGETPEALVGDLGHEVLRHLVAVGHLPRRAGRWPGWARAPPRWPPAARGACAAVRRPAADLRHAMSRSPGNSSLVIANTRATLRAGGPSRQRSGRDDVGTADIRMVHAFTFRSKWATNSHCSLLRISQQ